MAKVFPNLKSHYHNVILLLSCGWSCTIIMILYFETTRMPLTRNPVSKPAACINHTCAPDREPEDWFCKRYAPTVQLFLNSRNSALNANVSKWWMRLFGTHGANYTTLVGNLFQLLPDKEHNSDIHPHRCRTCAVVGNSGNLLGSRYGPLIDSKSFVMRINRGKTKGFEEDVGSKTTHRIFYPESYWNLENSTHLVYFPFKVADIEWLIRVYTMENKKNIAEKINKDKLMILHPGFMKYVHMNWTESHGNYPSTGFLTVIFALHICDEVHVFGFGATQNGSWHHYFDKSLTPYSKTNHPGHYEYETISRLHSEKKLLMYKGWT
ncbi:CMP-N-acetylneuraminate-beta-galactosamide-alpha-2,3-sialyltransferase 1-like [Paramisgurnus dabryanus]|uniref:CMP-N-acetylneuraminate-beta-galactosamide- alpha-2,3-sialyltransferase 1-like n=1 Tax=Paramisgurnus dabryanus TaxID=90735 RepID=UPI0031F432F3